MLRYPPRVDRIRAWRSKVLSLILGHIGCLACTLFLWLVLSWKILGGSRRRYLFLRRVFGFLYKLLFLLVFSILVGLAIFSTPLSIASIVSFPPPSFLVLFPLTVFTFPPFFSLVSNAKDGLQSMQTGHMPLRPESARDRELGRKLGDQQLQKHDAAYVPLQGVTGTDSRQPQSLILFIIFK